MPLYPLSKQVLLSLALSFPLVSCGDGGTDPAELIHVTIVSGDGQSTGLGEILSQDLVVRTSDALGNTVANVDLLFTVVQGGGSLSVEAVKTNGQGTASSTWTVGNQEGPQQVTVSAVTNSGAEAAFSAVATEFNIELVFITSGTPSQNAAFFAAADRWMNILRGDLPEVDFSSMPVPANTCLQGQPTFSGTIDDLRIYVDITPIDGLLGTLGQAGPCQIRTTSQLPLLAFIQLDSDDVTQLEQDGDLLDVILHEMGHALGIGTLWDNFDTLLVNPSLPPSLPADPGVDTHFAGAAAIAAFDAAGGTAYTAGAKVPVDNQANVGSSDAHWREPVLRLELMTPELTPGVTNPLSAITTESLADLGYSVDSSEADAFTLTFSAPASLTVLGGPASPTAVGAPANLTAPGGRVINLRNDIYRGPLRVVDHSGNVIRTVFWR